MSQRAKKFGQTPDLMSSLLAQKGLLYWERRFNFLVFLNVNFFRASTFMIRHFAADVSYQIDGFVEKNKDSVNAQLLEVISQTKVSKIKLN